MHFMPNNNLEENISHFILIAPTKKKLPPKIAFQILGTQKLHLGNQVPGSRKFSCPARNNRQLTRHIRTLHTVGSTLDNSKATFTLNTLAVGEVILKGRKYWHIGKSVDAYVEST